jgi:hypothetical protein
MTRTERDDMNRKIAEDLGWTVPLTPGLKCQRCRYSFSDMQHGCPECSDKYPPNYFTDPTCTLLLMGRMIQSVVLHVWLKEGQVFIGYENSKYFGQGPFTADAIGEAVALAYAKMRGLK